MALRIGLLVVIAMVCFVGLASAIAVPLAAQDFRCVGTHSQSQAKTTWSLKLTGGDPVGGGGTPRIVPIADSKI